MAELVCGLCGNTDVRFQFLEESRGRRFESYYCPACDLYQTLGQVDAVSPDYVDLGVQDLVGEHVFLQRAHKRPAFEQWLNLTRQPAGGARRRVLDIGCGVGGFLDFAAEHGFETFGFDASSAQADAARTNHPNVRNAVTLDDYLAALGQDICFDLVTMWDVFEHIREPREVLASVRARLADEGRVFVSVPNGAPNRWKVRLAKLRGRAPGLIPWEHVFYYTTRSLPRMFQECDFDVLDVGGVATYVRAPGPHETVRRILHSQLRSTPLAFQIYALASPRR